MRPVLFQDVDSMWRSTIRSLCLHGVDRQSRNGPTRELIAFSASVANPSGVADSRQMSPTYAAGELLWYLSGSDSGEQISHYAPSYSKFLNSEGRAEGAYGKRWAPQLGRLLSALKSDKTTRQAVLATWYPSDVGRSSLDMPCTLVLHFLIRDNKLQLIVTMRSNDAWLGMPYDVYCFTRIQKMVADEVGVELGVYTHQVGSMHLYRSDFEKAFHRASDDPFMPDMPTFAPIAQGAMLEACEAAATLEAEARCGTRPPTDVANIAWFTHPLISGTELGSIVAVAAMKSGASLGDIESRPLIRRSGR